MRIYTHVLKHLDHQFQLSKEQLNVTEDTLTVCKDQTHMLFMSTCSCEHTYMHTSQHTIELWVHALIKVLGLMFTVSFTFWTQAYYGFLFSAFWPAVGLCISHHLLQKKFIWWELRDAVDYWYKDNLEAGHYYVQLAE